MQRSRLVLMLALRYGVVGVGRYLPSGRGLVSCGTCIGRMAGALTMLRTSRPSLDSVYADVRELGAVSTNADLGRARMPVRNELALEHVRYQYPGAHCPVVQDLSFTIPAGSSVALVGPTGRGKTTAVKLILGLLTPEAGGVLVDGNGLGGRDASARLHVGYISQFIYLRDDTIRRNVALGLPDAEIAEWRMRTALHAAQLEEFVASLPAGVQTIVGERGVRLSGGQRQRIGIARALYSDPSLLVMDEGTSALDAGTEKAVVDTVLEARGERTLIMIAHRMSTVKWCDQLYYLDGGELVAQGTYKDLYAQRSRLSAMAG